MCYRIALLLILHLSTIQVSAQVTELTKSSTVERNKLVSMPNDVDNNLVDNNAVPSQKVDLYIPKKPWYNPYIYNKPPVAVAKNMNNSRSHTWGIYFASYARRYDNMYGVKSTTPK